MSHYLANKKSDGSPFSCMVVADYDILTCYYIFIHLKIKYLHNLIIFSSVHKMFILQNLGNTSKQFNVPKIIQIMTLFLLIK